MALFSEVDIGTVISVGFGLFLVGLFVYSLVSYFVNKNRGAADEGDFDDDYEPSEASTDNESEGGSDGEEDSEFEEHDTPLLASVDDTKPADTGQSQISVEVEVPEEVVNVVNAPREIYNEQMANMHLAREKYVADAPTMDEVGKNSRALAGQILSDSLNAFSDQYFRFNVQPLA